MVGLIVDSQDQSSAVPHEIIDTRYGIGLHVIAIPPENFKLLTKVSGPCKWRILNSYSDNIISRANRFYFSHFQYILSVLH